MPKRIGMTLSICSYKKIYICIVVAQDFQVSNSGSWEPLVLEPPWNPPLKNFWIRAWITDKNYTPYNFVIESVSSKLAITITKQKVVVSFIKGASTPTGLIIPVINVL
jgi:hypothetical protein